MTSVSYSENFETLERLLKEDQERVSSSVGGKLGISLEI